MFLPNTHFGCLLCLLLALLCFTSWPNVYKRVQGRWRYELFAVDFAIGALLLAALLAYTLGTFGPEISFTDRILIAGRSLSILIIGAGIAFALANLLLLGAISLLGLSGTLPISLGLAAAGAALLRMRGPSTVPLLAGAILMLISAAVAWTAVRAAVTAQKRASASNGLALAVLSGLILIGVQAILRTTSDPEFGPGPYATALMFAIGLFLATPCLDFFFMNIKLVGSRISFASYRLGGFNAHLPGLLSGFLWTCGLLMLYLAMSGSGLAELSRRLMFVVPLLAVPLLSLIGLRRWKEFSAAPARSRGLLQAAAACFLVALLVIGFGLTS